MLCWGAREPYSLIQVDSASLSLFDGSTQLRRNLFPQIGISWVESQHQANSLRAQEIQTRLLTRFEIWAEQHWYQEYDQERLDEWASSLLWQRSSTKHDFNILEESTDEFKIWDEKCFLAKTFHQGISKQIKFAFIEIQESTKLLNFWKELKHLGVPHCDKCPNYVLRQNYNILA